MRSGRRAHRQRPARWWAVAAALFCLSPLGPAQMRPDAPIMNFRFPVFGDNGYKIWELRGAEGRYLSDEQGMVIGLDLKTYSGDASMRLENRIRSPEALIHFPTATAEGTSSLFATGAQYQISGTDWRWEGKERHLTVNGGARVVIFDKIDILR